MSTRGHHSFRGGRTKKNPCNQKRKGSPGVEPLTRGMTDLTISHRPATPFHRLDPPSPTSDEANPNPSGLGSDSSSRISPLGNWVIRRVGPVTHLKLYPTGRRPPRRHHRCASLGLNGVVSPILPLGTERWGGGGWGRRQAT
jgi:hypothetical protein